jgi:hypothetical protein
MAKLKNQSPRRRRRNPRPRNLPPRSQEQLAFPLTLSVPNPLILRFLSSVPHFYNRSLSIRCNFLLLSQNTKSLPPLD